MPFIEEILNNTTQIICDLQPHQHHTFYEAVGLMIQSQQDAIIQENLIKRYMQLPNQGFKTIIDNATNDVTTLREHDTVKNLAIILKTNVRACKSLGHSYFIQLAGIYLDMLNVYKVNSFLRFIFIRNSDFWWLWRHFEIFNIFDVILDLSIFLTSSSIFLYFWRHFFWKWWYFKTF